MGKYDDIIHLPHHVSRNHPQMTMYQRAAQFAPFAALTGHGAAISETARLTDHEIELSDNERNMLDMKFNMLLQRLAEHPSITITHFVPDSRKEGGRYVTFTGKVRKWDEYLQTLTFTDGTTVSLRRIIDIDEIK